MPGFDDGKASSSRQNWFDRVLGGRRNVERCLGRKVRQLSFLTEFSKKGSHRHITRSQPSQHIYTLVFCRAFFVG